jgi:hypothetical protein
LLQRVLGLLPWLLRERIELPNLGNALEFLTFYEVSKPDITPDTHGNSPPSDFPSSSHDPANLRVLVGHVFHFPREKMGETL